MLETKSNSNEPKNEIKNNIDKIQSLGLTSFYEQLKPILDTLLSIAEPNFDILNTEVSSSIKSIRDQIIDDKNKVNSLEYLIHVYNFMVNASKLEKEIANVKLKIKKFVKQSDTSLVVYIKSIDSLNELKVTNTSPDLEHEIESLVGLVTVKIVNIQNGNKNADMHLKYISKIEDIYKENLRELRRKYPDIKQRLDGYKIDLISKLNRISFIKKIVIGSIAIVVLLCIYNFFATTYYFNYTTSISSVSDPSESIISLVIGISSFIGITLLGYGFYRIKKAQETGDPSVSASAFATIAIGGMFSVVPYMVKTMFVGINNSEVVDEPVTKVEKTKVYIDLLNFGNTGTFILLTLIVVLTYFTYRNMVKNKKINHSIQLIDEAFQSKEKVKELPEPTIVSESTIKVKQTTYTQLS